MRKRLNKGNPIYITVYRTIGYIRLKKNRGVDMKNKSRVFAFLAIVATVFIFFNSLQNATKSDASSSVFVNVVIGLFPKTNIGTVTFLVRKAAHMTEFFVQAFMIGLAYVFGKRKFTERVVYVLFFGLLTACFDELLQHFVEGRADLVTDIWIDFCGAVFATVLCFIISKFQKSEEDNK